MRRTLATLTVLLGALTLVSACSDDEPSNGDSTEPKVITVTVEGDNVTPNGERIEVSTGQQIDLEVTADAPGEIHVHSDPEQELEYEAGTHTVTIDPIDVPGTVEVESHTLDKVIVQLEVR